MKNIRIALNKEALLNRCVADIAILLTKIKDISAEDVGITEHDQLWFIVALDAAYTDTYDAIACIVDSDVNYPQQADDELCFDVICCNERQEKLLPGALENYLIANIVHQWFYQRHAQQVNNPVEAYDKLRHVALINNGVSLKNTF